MNVIHCEGSPYEMGYIQGQKQKKLIRETENFIKEYKFIKEIIPDFLNMDLLIRGVKTFAGLSSLVFMKDKKMYSRLKGIAEGAGVEIEVILLSQLLEIFLDRPLYYIGPCTTIGIKENFFKKKGPAVLKNFDYITGFEKFNLLRFSNPDKGYKSVELTMAQLAGSHTGMNEKGLCVSYNYGISIENIKAKIPYTLLVQRLLEEFDNTIDAINYILDMEFSHSAIITICDKTGNLKVLELTPHHKAIREPSPGENFTVATNFFVTKKMQQYDLPHNAYYAHHLPKAIRGQRIHRSNEMRYNLGLSLLKKKSKISLKYLFNIAAAHTPDTNGDDDSICRHHEFFNTLASMIMLPHYSEVYVTFEHPCKKNYIKFKLS